MSLIYNLCGQKKWGLIGQLVNRNPSLAMTPITTEKSILTTVVHQAIAGKGKIEARTALILDILRETPDVARIKNGHGSLPLHTVCQRNTNLSARSKEKIIMELIKANPSALTEQAGAGKRTPIHVLFTDYISADLTRTMIDLGTEACFMKDSKGYLPAHIACSRHCSPVKLQMLLDVHPGALYDKTNDGETCMSLALATATKTHPNYKLIDAIKDNLNATAAPTVTMQSTPPRQVMMTGLPTAVSREETVVSPSTATSFTAMGTLDATIEHDSDSTGFEKKPPTFTSFSSGNPADLLLHFSRTSVANTNTDDHSSTSPEENDADCMLCVEV